MSWREKLLSLNTDETGRREVQEPLATEIVLEFMKNEVYPSFQCMQNVFAEKGLQAEISPSLPCEVSLPRALVCLTVWQQVNGNRFYSSLTFEREEGFNLRGQLISRHRSDLTLAIDRPERNPIAAVELYLKYFYQSIAV
jgi:hypothetical protein